MLRCSCLELLSSLLPVDSVESLETGFFSLLSLSAIDPLEMGLVSLSSLSAVGPSETGRAGVMLVQAVRELGAWGVVMLVTSGFD